MSLLEDVLHTLKCYRGEIAVNKKRPNDLRDTDAVIDRLQAAMQTSVLVPREPTEGMIACGAQQYSPDIITADWTVATYKAMLSAAETKEK